MFISWSVIPWLLQQYGLGSTSGVPHSVLYANLPFYLLKVCMFLCVCACVSVIVTTDLVCFTSPVTHKPTYMQGCWTDLHPPCTSSCFLLSPSFLLHHQLLPFVSKVADWVRIQNTVLWWETNLSSDRIVETVVTSIIIYNIFSAWLFSCSWGPSCCLHPLSSLTLPPPPHSLSLSFPHSLSLTHSSLPPQTLIYTSSHSTFIYQF